MTASRAVSGRVTRAVARLARATATSARTGPPPAAVATERASRVPNPLIKGARPRGRARTAATTAARDRPGRPGSRRRRAARPIPGTARRPGKATAPADRRTETARSRTTSASRVAPRAVVIRTVLDTASAGARTTAAARWEVR